MANPRRESGVWLSILTALLLMSVHVAGRAVRDTLFLSNFPIERLPQMMIGAAAISLAAAALASAVLARFSPARVIPWAMMTSGALFLIEWSFVQTAPGAGGVAVYLHLAALSLVLFSGFWSIVNERFDPFTAKSVIARAQGYGALGGAIGGGAVVLVAPRIGADAMLPAFAALHVACGIAALRLGLPGANRSRAPAMTRGRSGLREVMSSPLLQKMALVLILVQATEQLIDYVFKATAAGVFAEEAELVRFFALFYTASSLFAFGIQTTLGSRLLMGLGIGGTLALLPATVALTGAAAGFVQNLWTATIVRASNAVLAISSFKSSFELLWTPIPMESKRPAKVYVDVGAAGLGDLAGAGLVFAIVAGFATAATFLSLAFAVGCSVGSVLIVSALHRGYVRQLADNLRSGTVAAEEVEVQDATTARTLADTRVTIDRAELLARIEELDRQAEERAGSELRAGADVVGPSASGVADEVAALASGQPDRAGPVLRRRPARRALVAHAVPLLESHELRADALDFLRDQAPRVVGQLTDLLLDPGTPVLVRRRIPGVLEAASGGRALEALIEGLADDDFEVQLECARSAVRIVDAEPELAQPRPRVHELAMHGLSVGDRTWEHHGRRRSFSADTPAILEPADLGRIDRSLEMVFTILALAYGRDVMASTLRALHADDLTLRGTALEYLQTALPEKLRGPLMRRIPGGATARITMRRSEELVEALMQSSAALPRP